MKARASSSSPQLARRQGFAHSMREQPTASERDPGEWPQVLPQRGERELGRGGHGMDGRVAQARKGVRVGARG